MTSDMAQEAPSKNPTEGKIHVTKEKLLAELGDGTLEQLMRERARIRKEKDEHSIAELRVLLTTLENALTVETKRRIEMSRCIEEEYQKQIEAVTQKLEYAIDQKSEAFQKRLCSLENKVDELSERMQEQSKVVPEDIQRLGKDLQESILTIQEEFRVESSDRNQRQNNILQQINDYEEYTSQQIEQECDIRQTSISNLNKTLQTQEKNRTEVDAKFQSLVDTELNTLQEKLAQETTERKMEDNDIVDGLNIYTEKLQYTLALMADKY